jgi:hypothetical protein
MTRKIIIALALLLAVDTASAVRVIELVERAVELTLDELTLPSGSGSTISFSECASCGISTHRLTDQTVYQANRQTLPLAEFLAVAEEIRNAPNASIAVATVYLDIATGRVTRIEVRE